MATTTTKLGLTKPDGADLVDIAVLNTNADKIDAAVGASIVTSVTRPSSPYSGQAIYETDSKATSVWVPSISTWQPINAPFVCTSTTRPTVPYQGQVIYETNTDTTYIRNSTSWVRMGGVPAGTVVAVGTATMPTGYLLCDGTVYNNTAYPELATALGLTYGGVSGTSFAVPNLLGKTVVGKAASGTFGSLNATGGSETHTLTTGEMPSHGHDVYAEWGASGEAPFNVIYNSNMQLAGVSAGTRSLKGSIVAANGGGAAHNNLQPYRVLNYAIRY